MMQGLTKVVASEVAQQTTAITTPLCSTRNSTKNKARVEEVETGFSVEEVDLKNAHACTSSGLCTGQRQQ